MNSNSDRIADDLKRIVQDAEQVLTDTTEVASEKAKVARERLLAAVAAAKDCCEHLQEKTAAGAKATDKVIRDNPYQSIGIAFGVGLLVGWIVTRK